jgi:hypothetical protein
MENESNEIYAAFGLDAPSADEATEETSAADETAENPGTGPDDSNPADTSTEDSNTSEQETEPEAEPEAAESEPEPASQPVQDDTSAQDANYAAAFLGRKNPYTGKPILSKADFEQYKKDLAAAEEAEQRQAADDEAAKLGFTPEQIQNIFLKSEMGRKMQAALDYTQQQAAENHRRAIDDLIAKDIAEIAKYDPSVKDVDSLKKTAHGKEIEARVNSGRYTWKEAWMLENFDAMQTARSDATRQAAINSASSKDHLQSTAQRGGGEIDVPSDVLSYYKAMGFDDMDEIRKSYGDYLKDIKKG